MGKIADLYFKEDPWMIVEEGFDPDHSMIAESVFSQANEYMGIRGYLEEGYSGEHLQGSYFNGIYERKSQEGPHYKGITNTTEFMVNSAEWLYTELYINGKRLDLAVEKITDFIRKLDMKNGLLTRSFIWELPEGQKAELTFERLLSMENVETAAQKITVRLLNFSGMVEIRAGIDFSVIHKSAEMNFWKNVTVRQQDNHYTASAETINTQQKLCSSIQVHAPKLTQQDSIQEEKKGMLVFSGMVQEGDIVTLERSVRNLVCRDGEDRNTFHKEAQQIENSLANVTFEGILKSNTEWWKKVWEVSDIQIEGDNANQQGIRFCIFQLFQTYHGAVDGSNIGAKGLTGEAYNGNAFWDTETYCLPFFLFQDQEGARNLLKFRYRTLQEAKNRAKELDCRGAFYPIATISGRECCNLWQHASLQLQASTAVAFGIWCYEHIIGDRGFMKECGLEMLIEISRMLATRGDYFDEGRKYGYFSVMGPDEFQMMVNNNFYTNAMGKFALQYTLSELKKMEAEDHDTMKKVSDLTGLTDEECSSWKDMAEKMYIPFHEVTGLYEQHAGFFDLPHVDVDAIPVEDFPLYEHWSYDRIYRNDMIKQPDVLMMMLLFNQSFPEEILRKNYEFYEPKCIHESSLSPSVHSILAAQLGKYEEAYEFFRFATRMDLDNYNRNSGEGIHTTSIAAAWMNIVYGYGGFRPDGSVYILNPTIPLVWESYRFGMKFGDIVLEIYVDQEEVRLTPKGEGELELQIYDEKITLKDSVYTVKIPEKWRCGHGMGNS